MIARSLRENGFIAMKGRGNSAATMSPTDAANLLIGVNADPVAAGVVKLVGVYRNLEANEVRPKTARRPSYVLGTFGSALEVLIEAYRSGELPDQFIGKKISTETQARFKAQELDFQVSFFRPSLGASIRVTAVGRDLRPDLETYLAETAPPMLFFSFRPQSRPWKNYKNTDRIEQTTISRWTLRAVGRCLQKSYAVGDESPWPPSVVDFDRL
jgi:hypothetical protein